MVKSVTVVTKLLYFLCSYPHEKQKKECIVGVTEHGHPEFNYCK